MLKGNFTILYDIISSLFWSEYWNINGKKCWYHGSLKCVMVWLIKCEWGFYKMIISCIYSCLCSTDCLPCLLSGKLRWWLSFIKEVNKEGWCMAWVRQLALLIGIMCRFDVGLWRRRRHQEQTKHVTWEHGQPRCSPLSLCSPSDHAVVLCVFVGFGKSRSPHSF